MFNLRVHRRLSLISNEVKKKVNLQTLLNLKQTIESLVSSSTNNILANNAVLKSQKSDKVDTPAEYEKLKKLYNQLQIVKATIDKANKEKTKLGIPLNVLVYEKSDLERELKMLETLFNQKNTRRRRSAEDAYEFLITKDTISDRIKEIENRIVIIKDNMTLFNSSTLVKIDLDESLNLLETKT